MIFTSKRLPLAIYLHACAKLHFLRCERSDDHRVSFVFNDSEHRGNELELAFDSGAELPATAVFASQKFLRRKMSEALNNRRIGEYIVEQTS